jgi:capsular exopolysaccharide synthesis family protein
MATATPSFDIKILIKEFLKYWYLFVIFISLSLIVTVLYIKLAAQSYNVESSILIKTKSSSRSTEQTEFLGGFELINQEKIFNNEIQILQSIPMIKEVLKNLNLEVSYYSKGQSIPNTFKFTFTDIYKETPFIVIINEFHVQPVYTFFNIKILNDIEFIIESENKDVWLYNFEDDYSLAKIPSLSLNKKYKFGELIENNWCSFKVILNSNYQPEKYSDQHLLFMFNNLNLMAEGYKKALKIESSAWDATIAKIDFTGNNIQKSIDFVDGLINNYKQKSLENKNHLATTTIEYIDNQLASISDSLVYTERQLQNFRTNYNVMDIEEKSRQIYNQLQNLEQQRIEISNNRDILRQLDLYFTANEDSVVDFIPASVGIDIPLLNNLMQELTTLNNEKKQMILTDQLRNPRFQTVVASIENLQNAIRENIRFSLNVTNKSLEDIDSKIAKLNFEFSKLPQTQRQLVGIERKFKLTDAIYTSMLEKRVQAQIAKASNVPDCDVIEPARYMSIAAPKSLYILLGGLFLGFLIPGSYVLGRKFLTEKISDPDEIKRYCQLQRLGYIPQQKKISENIIITQPDEPITEYFRSIRSNLDYFLMGKKHKNILITSSLPQEGKSFVAINIASSLAIAQQKTLLIGFDLRKRNDLYDEFGFHKLVGISSYLVGNASLEDIIISTKIENLDLIISGDTPPNPVELISSDKTKELLQEVRLMYDYVIIDTPPFGLLTDAFILMKYSDLNIFVARLNIITKKALIESMVEIREKKLNNTYLLVNSIKAGGLGYYSYKGYPYKKSKKDRTKITEPVKSKESTELVS